MCLFLASLAMRRRPLRHRLTIASSGLDNRGVIIRLFRMLADPNRASKLTVAVNYVCTLLLVRCRYRLRAYAVVLPAFARPSTTQFPALVWCATFCRVKASSSKPTGFGEGAAGYCSRHKRLISCRGGSGSTWVCRLASPSPCNLGSLGNLANVRAPCEPQGIVGLNPRTMSDVERDVAAHPFIAKTIYESNIDIENPKMWPMHVGAPRGLQEKSHSACATPGQRIYAFPNASPLDARMLLIPICI